MLLELENKIGQNGFFSQLKKHNFTNSIVGLKHFFWLCWQVDIILTPESTQLGKQLPLLQTVSIFCYYSTLFLDKVDFTVESHKKTNRDLDQALLKGTITSGVKRTASILESDEDNLRYSDDDEEVNEISNKENQLEPKTGGMILGILVGR